jgi:hypothetical protein
MDAEATRIAELVAEACGLVEGAERAHADDPDLAAALELVRMDLLAAAFNTTVVAATDDACGAVAEIDRALVALRSLPSGEQLTARAS